MKKLIDQFGELDEQIKELTKKKNKIKKKLEKLDPGKHLGDKHYIILSEEEKVEYDVIKVAHALKKETLKVVKVIGTELKKYIPKTKLGQYIKSRTTYKKIRVGRI